MVLGGGTIPDEDIPKLKAIGIETVFTPGANRQDAIAFARSHLKRK